MLVLGARLTVDDRGADVADVKPKSSLGVWEALRADRLEEAWTRSSQTTVGGGMDGLLGCPTKLRSMVSKWVITYV